MKENKNYNKMMKPMNTQDLITIANEQGSTIMDQDDLDSAPDLYAS